SDGMHGADALPSGPWHCTHTSALRFPAWTSAACAPPCAAAVKAAAIASPPIQRAKEHPRRAARRGGRNADARNSVLVTDPVNRSGIVVRDQQRSVLHLRSVHRASPELVPRLEPSLGEHLVLRHVATPQRDHHDPIADLLGAVPRAALRQEHAVLVLRR